MKRLHTIAVLLLVGIVVLRATHPLVMGGVAVSVAIAIVTGHAPRLLLVVWLTEFLCQVATLDAAAYFVLLSALDRVLCPLSLITQVSCSSVLPGIAVAVPVWAVLDRRSESALLLIGTWLWSAVASGLLSWLASCGGLATESLSMTLPVARLTAALLILIVVGRFCEGDSPEPVELDRISYVIPGVLGLLVVVAALPPRNAIPSATVGAANRRSVVLWWPRPERDLGDDFSRAVDRGGLDRIGLFGELPEVLTRARYDVRLVSSLDTPNLGESGVLFMLAPFRKLRGSEIEAIRAFVSSGGRLVVTGEHTNLDSNRDIYNELLRPWRVALEFDTATNLLANTLLGTCPLRHPLGSLFARHPAVVYTRGASLRVDGATPVLVGRDWISDVGDLHAEARGYIGDERWTTGDRLGSIVLVAVRRVGRGVVVVFGDTSPFINRNLVHNAAFVADFVALLAGGDGDGADLGTWLTVLVSVAAVLSSLLVIRRASCLSLGLWRYVNSGATIGVSALLIAVSLPPSIPKVELGRSLVISTVEGNAFSRNPFSVGSVTALGVAGLRENYTPRFGDWHGAKIADLVVILNPTLPIDLGAVERLVRDGGRVVICGDGENPHFRQVIRRYDCTLGEAPVGALQSEAVKTYEAWKLDCPVGSDSIKAGEVSIGVRIAGARGELILLADRGLLLSKNLEDSSRRDSTNASFVTTLLR